MSDDELIEDIMQALANDDEDVHSPTPVYSSQEEVSSSQESVQAVDPDTEDTRKPSLLQLLRAAAHGSAAGLSMTSEMHFATSAIHFSSSVLPPLSDIASSVLSPLAIHFSSVVHDK